MADKRVVFAGCVAAGLILGVATDPSGGSGGQHHNQHHGAVASVLAEVGSIFGGGDAMDAISYAMAQRGKPYCWGGVGTECYDCSGLAMEAYRAAGVNIPRTSQAQWAWGVQNGKTVSWRDREPGDLVFFAGSDGTQGAPGHVVMLIGRNSVVQAYAAGYPIKVTAVSWGETSPVTGVIRPTKRT